jgi:competence protein ComEA
VREAKNQDDIVSARLQVVLATTDHGVREEQSPVPPGSGDFTDLSPLKWSDIVPSWPDDVDLDPRDDWAAMSSSAADDPPEPVSAGPLTSPAVPPVAAPPSASEQDAPIMSDRPLESDSLVLEALAGRSPLASQHGSPRAATLPRLAVPAKIEPDSPAFYPGSLRRRPGAPAESPAGWADAATAALPVTPEPLSTESGMPRWTFEDGADDGQNAGPESALTAAGAFDSSRRGSRAGKPEPGSRLLAFDPGRRGVKALAAVAVAVVMIAAVLAWRARPRIDPVAVPPVEVTATTADRSAGAAGAAAIPARPGTSGGTEVVVAVGGKVRKPGLVRLPPGARVADALQAAGGADPGIDVALLNLARKVVDGELILVGVTPPPGAAAPNPGAPNGGGPAAGGAGAPAGGPVNLNTATLAELDGLPGVGPVLAQRILDAREAHGGFRAVSDLRKVDGIGDARYEQLKDLVVV